MQYLVTFIGAGPAARVPQKVHVFKQDGTEKGCIIWITLFEYLHVFRDKSRIHCGHRSPAR